MWDTLYMYYCILLDDISKNQFSRETDIEYLFCFCDENACTGTIQHCIILPFLHYVALNGILGMDYLVKLTKILCKNERKIQS